MSGYKRGIIVPMTASFMTRLDEVYSPKLGWIKATL